MSTRHMLLAIVTLLVAVGFSTRAFAQTPNVLSGSVTLGQAAALSAGARLIVELVETAPNTPQRVAADITIFNISNKTAPYQFALPIDPTKINPTSAYVLQITLAEGMQTRFRGTVPVLNGKPTPGNVVLQRSTGNLPAPSAGSRTLLLGVSLFALAAGLACWRRSRCFSPVRATNV